MLTHKTKIREIKKTLKRSIFQIHIQNSSNNTVHINKDSKLGEIYEIDDIKISEALNDETKMTQNLSQSVNLIQASPEVLDLRKKDISPIDFEFTHLNECEKSQILQLLLNNYSAFSKSFKSLGHTDRVVPKFKFTSDFFYKDTSISHSFFVTENHSGSNKSAS